MSEAANLLLQWIFVLNSIKHKFFYASIAKIVDTYSMVYTFYSSLLNH